MTVSVMPRLFVAVIPAGGKQLVQHCRQVRFEARFLEIEVVVTQGMRQARALMKELREALGIRPTDVIAGSYGELAAKR